MPTVIHQLADAFLKRKEALAERSQAKTKLAGSDYFMPKSAKQDLSNKLSVFEQGGLPELLKQGASEMYHNPIVNTAISLTPGAGDVQSGYEAVQSAREGNWGEAGLNALGVLPFVPALGGMVKKAENISDFDFNVTKKDASDIFGEGASRIKYEDPNSKGFIDVVQRPDGTASVLGLEVPEAARGKGIGQNLQQKVLSDFPAMQGQVSSKAAATTAYRLGRRPVNQPNATLDDVYRMIDEDSSVNLVSPKMQKQFDVQRSGTSVFEFPKD